MIGRAWWSAALAVAIAAGCAERDGVRVELDAFSGRPNPHWELPPSEASEIAETLGSLPQVHTPVHIPGLGYRGFLLHHDNQSIRVYRGYVIRERDGRATTYRDTANLERQLTATAHAHGYGNVIR